MTVTATRRIQPGDHVALIYRTRAEQLSWVCEYIGEGLERDERCFYIAHENSVPSILAALSKSGIPAEAAEQTGALKILTRDQSYLRHGIFAPEQMIADLKTEINTALNDGFTGLRASGEMTWALDIPEALAKVREYEVALHRNFGPRLTGLCQYDENRFDPELLSDVIRLHPKVIANGRIANNPYHRSPEQLVERRWPTITSTLLPGGILGV